MPLGPKGRHAYFVHSYHLNASNEADVLARADYGGPVTAMVGKDTVMMPWECRMSNYQTRDGMIVPLTGEVAWLRPKWRKSYWRGTVTSLTYEFQP